MQNYNTLGVILARAGSLGLPGKHLKPLLGRPVADWSMDHAQAATSLTRVVATTDCPDVRRLARERGLATLVRPPELATSEASVQDVLIHALDAVEARTDWRADAVVILYANVPVRPDGCIDDCVHLLRESGCDSVRTFQPTGKFHPRWMSRVMPDGLVEPVVPGSVHRRQDLEPLFLHDGACVAIKRSALDAAREQRDDPHAMFGDDRRGIRVMMGSAIEIDEPRDLMFAEAVLRERGEATKHIRLAA